MLGGCRPRALAAMYALMWRAWPVWLACLTCVALWPSSAPAATPAEAGDDALARARALFAEALHDEQAGHYADALQKFRQVGTVRDTPAVEYRIGTCQEGLGDDVGAFAAYRDAAELGHDDPAGVEIADAARQKLVAIGKRVALLTLVLAEPAPSDAEVRVDGALLPPVELRRAVVLAPGAHLITATASVGAAREAITLAAGARVTLTLAIAPAGAALPAPGPDGAAVVAGSASLDPTAPRSAAEVPTPPPGDGLRRTAGWIAIVGGGSLVIASAVVLAVRATDIGALDQQCPGGLCPVGSDRAAIESRRDRAVVEGPVAVALGAVGVAAIGAGVYAVLSADAGGQPPPKLARTPGARLQASPWLAPGLAGVAVAGTLP